MAARVPKAMEATIRQVAIMPAGMNPAMNMPPIEMFETKARMMRLMQGGIDSAMTADAPSSATALPGFCLARLPRG